MVSAEAIEVRAMSGATVVGVRAFYVVSPFGNVSEWQRRQRLNTRDALGFMAQVLYNRAINTYPAAQAP